jgi:hypothetical protein
MRKAAVIAAVTVALLCTTAAAQEKTDEQLRKEYEGLSWEKAHVIESEHYTLRCNSTEEVTKRYSEVMEKLFKLYNATFPNLSTKEMKWEVWIYKTRREFQKRHPQRAAATAGYYSPSNKRIYTYHGLFGVSGSTFNILAHEGTHAFQHSFLKSYAQTPTWLLEGMAVVLEGVEVAKDGKLSLKKPSRDRILQVKVELKTGKALKLTDVVGEKAKPFSRKAYAYAGMFIWWLAKTGPRQRKVIDELLSALSTRGYEKDDIEKLLQSHLGKGLAAVEREWRGWVRKQKVEYTGTKGPGGNYSSKLLRFKIKRPNTGWAMDADKAPLDGECVVYKRPRTGARLSVTVYTNQLPLNADELYLQMLRDLSDKVKELTVEHKERRKIKGQPGFTIIYVGSEPASRITTEKQRVQLSAIVTAHHIYVLRLQSPPGKWDTNRPDFARALEKFKLSK